eukprot:123285-Hanusia_phi.AAC.1
MGMPAWQALSIIRLIPPGVALNSWAHRSRLAKSPQAAVQVPMNPGPRACGRVSGSRLGSACSSSTAPGPAVCRVSPGATFLTSLV